MVSHQGSVRPQVRLWIVVTPDWRPSHWADLPGEAIAHAPAEPGCVDLDAAAAYVEGFNRAQLAQRGRHWAVAVPVHIHFEGDLSAGERVSASKLVSFRSAWPPPTDTHVPESGPSD